MRITSTGLPLDWTATQCAAYREVSRQQWLNDVKKGLEPPPMTSYRTLIDPGEDGRMMLWDAAQVRSWKRPDEWSATECAAHQGITVPQWTACVRQGMAPAAARKINGRSVWRQADVEETRLNITPKPVRTPRAPRTHTGPDPDADGWTAKECADYLGIAPAAWRAAVRAGEAPRSSGYTKSRTRIWDPKEVQNWGGAADQPADRDDEK